MAAKKKTSADPAVEIASAPAANADDDRELANAIATIAADVRVRGVAVVASELQMPAKTVEALVAGTARKGSKLIAAHRIAMGKAPDTPASPIAPPGGE